MDCPGCHGGVEKLIEKISGVASAHANWTKKQLVIKIQKGMTVDDAKIIDAIKRANFSVSNRLEKIK